MNSRSLEGLKREGSVAISFLERVDWFGTKSSAVLVDE